MNKERFGYLDHLRCLAIVGVIAAHTSQALDNPSLFGIEDYSLGRFGVQLFFLVSGSTVWLSLESCHRNYNKPWVAFYIKRALRIIPLFFFFSFTVFVARGFASPSYYFSPLAGLSADSINIVPGGWSIWNEIYFYIGLPAYAFARKKKRLLVCLGILLASTSLIIGLNHLHGTPDKDLALSDFDFLNIFVQFIFFQVGLEVTANNRSNVFWFFSSFFITSLTLKLIYFPEYMASPDYGSGAINSILAVFLSSIFVIFKNLESRHSTLFSTGISNFFKHIGRATYTMYVVHFGIIWLMSKMRVPVVDLLPSELTIALVLFMSYYVAMLIKPFTEDIWTLTGSRLIKRLEGKPFNI